MDRYLRTYESNGCLVVELNGEIDVEAAVAITPFLDDLTQAPGPTLVIDLSPVRFIDCSGLAVLCRARRRVLSHGGTVQLVCARPMTLRILRATGLMTAFRPVADLDTALARPAGDDP
ncbi:STAS domain-containing protein [Streptomyces sp. MI02-7b]|uniref:STAS domain-containing protein n=1 Tax=Streptomyces sp. MI02-7b TaxID=462941 RepID=UPI0029A158B3|nr:STAS domain-containing protein [Streptomyces sp. MI02-7b]MDX3073346.1 STAS domain-containing protein [Streptomyces sp. MI02-7b]